MEPSKTSNRIPDTFAERRRLRHLLSEFVADRSLIPPFSLPELEGYIQQIIEQSDLPAAYQNWLMVELNNAVWMETISKVPMENRLLMLPKCLSHSKKCRAEWDEMGLLCQRCSSCSIQDLQQEADEMGMLSIVAEGFSSIIPLIEQKVVDVIVGVGCLDSLEKAFPLMLRHGIPALAIPLNGCGCSDTDVDTSYVRDMMRLDSPEKRVPIDFEQIKNEVSGWFSEPHMRALFEKTNSAVSEPLIQFMARDGKRWRPFLMVASYAALTESSHIPEFVKHAAIAVECFHKASLIHDDIQDHDVKRNGFQTMHTTLGVEAAINLGDLLLGVGYQLLASTGNIKLIQSVAKAHTQLCEGQGFELKWSAAPEPVSMQSVLDLFALKTVPAFEVALTMAYECARQTDDVLYRQLVRYASEMGIAYQIKDDWDDFQHEDFVALRPSVVLAHVLQETEDAQKVHTILQAADLKSCFASENEKKMLESTLSEIRKMIEYRQTQVYDILKDIRSSELKRLLFLMTQSILKGLN